MLPTTNIGNIELLKLPKTAFLCNLKVRLVVNEHITDTPKSMPETRPTLWVRLAQLYLLDLPNSNP